METQRRMCTAFPSFLLPPPDRLCCFCARLCVARHTSCFQHIINPFCAVSLFSSFGIFINKITNHTVPLISFLPTLRLNLSVPQMNQVYLSQGFCLVLSCACNSLPQFFMYSLCPFLQTLLKCHVMN